MYILYYTIYIYIYTASQGDAARHDNTIICIIIMYSHNNVNFKIIIT